MGRRRGQKSLKQSHRIIALKSNHKSKLDLELFIKFAKHYLNLSNESKFLEENDKTRICRYWQPMGGEHVTQRRHHWLVALRPIIITTIEWNWWGKKWKIKSRVRRDNRRRNTGNDTSKERGPSPSRLSVWWSHVICNILRRVHTDTHLMICSICAGNIRCIVANSVTSISSKFY